MGRDRSLRSLDTVLQLFDIFFAPGFAIALAEFGDEAAREILFKFANPEYQAQLKAALTIQAALHVSERE